MFETIDDPEDTLRVPRWLWDLCVRLYRSTDPVMRAAAPGLLILRIPPEDEEYILRAAFEERFETWADALSDRALDDLERSLGLEICRMHEWLARLERDGFPVGDLVAFGCAREVLQAATCALEWRDREMWICDDLDRLDRAVVKALPRRSLIIRQKSDLLDRARRCDDMIWWALLTSGGSS
ncbi:hypothetical protein EDM68_04160 [Candidatus Uhrbacteria bacterium]|nr:MAG: hypothetical protein EDM68_04160 [Candidatus Uhrbacteria bacterium]